MGRINASDRLAITTLGEAELAKLTFSKPYQNWTTGLLGRFDRDDMVTQDATTIQFQFPNDYDDPPDIQGWTVTYKAATGSTFKYSAGEGGFQEAVSGAIGSVEVRNGSNQLVMKITEIDADIADIYPYIVNVNDGNGPEANPKTVMEYLVRGNDTFTGNNGDNSFGIHDDFGNDKYFGKGGSDYFESGAGNDTIDGGADFDHLSFKNSMWSQSARQGIVANLDTGIIIDTYGDTDTVKNIEMFTGSRFADTFLGPIGSPAQFFGVKGSRGADTFDFEVASNVWVIYDEDRWDGGKRGINADLGGVKNGSGDVKGTIKDGFGHTDKTVNVRRVDGTEFNDKFKGSRLDDHFNPGGEGVDSFNGGGGTDWIHFDTINRFGDNNPHGINVDLSLGSGQIIDDGFGNTENVTSIEAIFGSTFDDTIIGNSAANQFVAGPGSDTLTGNGGADKFIFGTYQGDGFGDTITDFTKGSDKLVFDRAYIDDLDAVVRFRNGTSSNAAAGQSQFFFNNNDDTLYLDINGTASGGVMMVAVLNGISSLSASDIQIVENYVDIV
jgi:Ca2+-binding RTX toxin-like protein